MANNSKTKRIRFSRRTPVNKLKLGRLRSDLRDVGASNYNLWLPETKFLAHLLEDDEQVAGAVYGRHQTGRGALFITPKRIIFVDKKPLFVHFDEFNFMVVNSVTFTRSGAYGVVTLHTRTGDFVIRTLNMPAAENFVEMIEQLVLRPRGFNITSGDAGTDYL